MKSISEKQLAAVETALIQSAAKPHFAITFRMAELMLNLMQRREPFGMFVILGWEKKWQDYADTPDISQDLFLRRHINIMDIIPGRPRKNTKDIVNTVNFDGAILIDAKGTILHSGTMIEGLRPRATAKKLNPKPAPDLSSQFGFKRKVHMRHIAAITSSYLFKGTLVFTISEETGDLHILENGRIIYSTVPGEIYRKKTK
jgi:DisA bacterial checkpoint controller nucleotide-binding